LKCDRYPCKYCFTSCAIRRKRTTFKPDELATTFVSLQRERRVDGLFLGYIHLKLIPGASFEYIERAVELAYGHGVRRRIGRSPS
jgi:predicted DNA-binding helix-hairpin-helix protein